MGLPDWGRVFLGIEKVKMLKSNLISKANTAG